ncbi:uncharacterized protein LOC132114296 [Carassius carassius]|uniref:uncharacterized protein LOC132114296 n=1 Tax=Carassius carassius TaxID=217509 RepID=UPI0028695B41|nr:uncharacterized protein LOC132114296 [Carassius carassius]
MPHRSGRVAIFTAVQETLIVDMVRENNLIRLREIRDKVIADNVNFESIDVSLATIDRVLRCQKMRMKQRILQLDAMARPHEYLFLDEAGFNLQKRRQRGRNIIGQRAITEVPGQRGVILLFVRPWVWRGLSTDMLSWVLQHATPQYFIHVTGHILSGQATGEKTPGKGYSVQLFHAQSAAIEDKINSREADTVDTLKIDMVLNYLLVNFMQLNGIVLMDHINN